MDINTGLQPAALSRHSQNTGDAVTTQTQREAMDIQEQQADDLFAGLEAAMSEAEAQEGQGGADGMGRYIDETV